MLENGELPQNISIPMLDEIYQLFDSISKSDMLIMTILQLGAYETANRNHKLQSIHNNFNVEDIISKLEAFDAGYDIGYSETEGFWGSRPAYYVQQAAQYLKRKNNVRCLDLGCGPGKNAVFLSKQGFQVEAMDSSYYAIVQAKSLSDQIKWKIRGS